LRRTESDAWRWLWSRPQASLAPDRLYRASDYLWAVRAAARQRRLPREAVSLDGMDVTALFEAERDRQLFEGGAVDSLLSSRLPRRLVSEGIRVELFVDVYENMI